MRNYKFRGKRIDNGDWVYGYYDGCYETATINYLREGIPYNVCIIPETVGQYTGLKDKNEKEIYEGDIFKNIKDGCISTVKWHGTMAGYIIQRREQGYKHLFEWGELFRVYDKHEVIGNIFDNPELLEREE